MKKHCVFAILLATLLALCLPLSCLAKPPVKATLYAAIYGSGDDTMAYRTLKIMPVQNFVFGLYSDDTLSVSTQLRLYFKADVTQIDSFTLSIEKLSSMIQTNTSLGLASYAINLIKLNSAGTITAYHSIRTSTQVSYGTSADGNDVYNWTWVNTGDALEYDVVQVTICFQNFMLNTTPIYFRLLDFNVNGMTAEELAINQYAEQFQARLERLEDIEDAAYQQIDIHVNDIREYLQNTDGDHYFADFHYLFSQSTLLSTMCAVVALFGILGFILFGKKV